MVEASVAPVLAQALTAQFPAIALRAEVDADFAFLTDLYAEVRHEEMAPVPWPQQAKRDFLDAQCRLQRDHYTKHYPGADRLLILRDGQPIGRVYVHPANAEIRLMDIAVTASARNAGIGTRIVIALQDECARRGADLTLHVEPTNPAQRLYRRLGFRLIENRGIYDFLGWTPPGSCGSRWV